MSLTIGTHVGPYEILSSAFNLQIPRNLMLRNPVSWELEMVVGSYRVLVVSSM